MIISHLEILNHFCKISFAMQGNSHSLKHQGWTFWSSYLPTTSAKHYLGLNSPGPALRRERSFGTYFMGIPRCKGICPGCKVDVRAERGSCAPIPSLVLSLPAHLSQASAWPLGIRSQVANEACYWNWSHRLHVNRFPNLPGSQHALDKHSSVQGICENKM